MLDVSPKYMIHDCCIWKLICVICGDLCATFGHFSPQLSQLPLKELHCEENNLLRHIPVHSQQEEEVLSLKVPDHFFSYCTLCAVSFLLSCQQNEDTLWRQHCWCDHVSQMCRCFATCATSVADTSFVSWYTKNVSERLQKYPLCPRGMQQCCGILPRTGNNEGHNVAATMCPRFARLNVQGTWPTPLLLK